MKLRPPATRDGLVVRTHILERLQAASEIPVVAIMAPAGYGKTTLLGQFQQIQERPSAWLTLDESDSDPISLFLNLKDALVAGGLVDERIDEEPISPDLLIRGVNALVAGVDPGLDGVIFIDQIDHLSTRESLDIIGALMTRMAGRARMVVASRSSDGLPLPLLRSRGLVSEFGAVDLAMDVDEAVAVFSAAGVASDRHIEAVLERTEGWPAGIYLSAIAIKAGSPVPDAVDVHGDDIFFADYLRTELLAQVPETLLPFLLRSSVLTRLSGPLCDYALEVTGSAETLAQLEAANLLIVPMDRNRTWYRYHSLMRDYLLSELERTQPEELTSIHARAATWFEEHGQPDLALAHIQLAGDDERFAGMVAANARRVFDEGRGETLAAWLDVLEERKEIGNHPALAALGGFARGLAGDAGGAERFAVFAYANAEGAPLEDDELDPMALMLRSFQVVRGPERALADAQSAIERFGTYQEFIHVCYGSAASATLAIEGPQAAEPLFAEGLWRAEPLQDYPYTTQALAERAVAAIDRNDWAEADSLVAQTLDIIKQVGIEGYLTSALAYSLAARLATRSGDVEKATSYLSSASAIRPRLTVALPLLAVQAQHEMVRAFIEAGDTAGARRVMRDASDIIAMRPRLGRLISDHETLQNRLETLPAGAVGASSLTKAELRLLPILVTHLTYPEIGERLFVSRHTVKTQAMSIYRKLGVSSRAEAVEKAREIGLISL